MNLQRPKSTAQGFKHRQKQNSINNNNWGPNDSLTYGGDDAIVANSKSVSKDFL